MDVHVPRAVTNGLRLRGIDVLTAQEDGCAGLDNAALLKRATELNSILVSQDKYLLHEGGNLQVAQERFHGIVYAHRPKVSIGQKARSGFATATIFCSQTFHKMWFTAGPRRNPRRCS